MAKKKCILAVEKKSTAKKMVKHSAFVSLVGNISRPISGGKNLSSCVFFFDSNEEKKIRADRL